MNVREFREEITEAFIRAIEFSLEPMTEGDRVCADRDPKWMLDHIKRQANQYATMRILTLASDHPGTLEPMP